MTEIRRRKLQFGLLTGVVALVSYLIIMVTGLGLGLNERAGTSLLALPGNYLAYADNADRSVIRSRLRAQDVEEVGQAPGVERATPLGYLAAVIEYQPGESETAAILGVVPGSFAAPRVVDGSPLDATGQVLVDRTWAAAVGTRVGDILPLPVDFQTRDFTVVGVVDQGYLFFQPTLYIGLDDWQGLVYQGGPEGQPAASIVLIQGEGLDGASSGRWEIVTKQEAFDSIEGVSAQQSTVDALRYMGLIIGTVVIGVFFYVITLQKVPLLGILKAIGASGLFLATQGLLQVLLVTTAGTLIAVGLALLTEATVLSADTVPIAFTGSALLTTSVSVIIGGLIGAALSVRQVAAIDPITAMQQH